MEWETLSISFDPDLELNNQVGLDHRLCVGFDLLGGFLRNAFWSALSEFSNAASLNLLLSTETEFVVSSNFLDLKTASFFVSWQRAEQMCKCRKSRTDRRTKVVVVLWLFFMILLQKIERTVEMEIEMNLITSCDLKNAD